MKKFWFLTVLGLLIFATTLYMVKQWDRSVSHAKEEEAPIIGALAPDFTLKDLDGKWVQIAKFRGKNPVFLNFWASWCPACRHETPENVKLHQLLGPKGLQLVSISIDKGPGAVSNVRKFMEEFKLSYNPLLDVKGDVMELYGVTAIPTTFLMDRNGKIVAKEVGPRNWTSSGWLNRLEELFK